jgi:hypothetical protein
MNDRKRNVMLDMKMERINLGVRRTAAINKTLFTTVSSNPISFVIVYLHDCHLSFMNRLKENTKY